MAAVGYRPDDAWNDDALRRSEQRAQLAVEVARLGTWHWERVGDVDRYEADARCREISGIAADDPVSREVLLAHVHPEDRPAVEAALNRALDPAGDGLYDEQMRFLHGDGSVRWTIARGLARFSGEGDARRPVALFGSLVDVTAQVLGSIKYRTLIDALDRGFCVVEMLFDERGRPIDYRFLETNPAFDLQTGMTGVVGKRMLELRPDHEEHWLRIYGEVAKTGEPAKFEHRAEALHRWFDVYAYRTGDPLAHQVGILFADITERKRIEQALLDADHRKDEFLATLAHELRNPLAPLRTALDILSMPHDPVLADRLHVVMARQVDQLTRLVGDLMEVSRITRGDIELRMVPVDVREVITASIETSRPMLDASGQSLELELADAPLMVDGDAMRLEQVITNLLNNAARYGRPDGHVRVRAWREDRRILVSVQDDGIGIPDHKLLEIFQPFTQLDHRVDGRQVGLGIGLSLVRNLVRRHGGEAVATSAGPGLGSEFLVTLPTVDTHPV